MKRMWLVIGLMMMAGTVNGAVIFSDDFTGTNGDPVNPGKWDVSAMPGATVSTQDNQGRIYSNTIWNFGQMTSTVGANFFASGATATYTVDVQHGYTLYGQTEVNVAGSGGSLKLHWTNEWPGSEMTYYTLMTTGSNPQTLWTGSQYWDEGERITITLTPTTYSLNLYNPKTNQTWATPSGDHGLSAGDFTGGGKLSFYTLMGNGNVMDDRFDNAQIDVVPEPATLGLMGISLAGLIRRRA